jgi:hypothetical protein
VLGLVLDTGAILNIKKEIKKIRKLLKVMENSEISFHERIDASEEVFEILLEVDFSLIEGLNASEEPTFDEYIAASNDFLKKFPFLMENPTNVVGKFSPSLAEEMTVIGETPKTKKVIH